MHPILFRIGSLTITTWGVFVLTGFIIGTLYVAREAKKAGYNTDMVYDLAFFVLLASLIGARLSYVFTHWQEFAQDPLEILRIWHGGMVFYGGVLLAVPVAYYYVKKHKLNPGPVADWIAPAFSIGIAIGRWGCFFNGCCFGKACSLPWCVVFPPISAAGHTFPGIKIHPTQLYESFGEFLLFLFLIYLKKFKLPRGFIFWTFAFFAALIRFVDDFFRYYEPDQFVMGMPIPQLISIIIMAVSAIAVLKLWISRSSKTT